MGAQPTTGVAPHESQLGAQFFARPVECLLHRPRRGQNEQRGPQDRRRVDDLQACSGRMCVQTGTDAVEQERIAASSDAAAEHHRDLDTMEVES